MDFVTEFILRFSDVRKEPSRNCGGAHASAAEYNQTAKISSMCALELG